MVETLGIFGGTFAPPHLDEIISLEKTLDIFVKGFYETYYGKELKRRQGKNYDLIKKTTWEIIQNAKDLLGVFNALISSDTVQ